MITTLPRCRRHPRFAACPAGGAHVLNYQAEKCRTVGTQLAARGKVPGGRCKLPYRVPLRLLALTQPALHAATIWGDDARYVETYFSKWVDADGQPRRDLYFPGDGAKRDSAGRFMILGRVDDVLNVAGHRIGTMEVESALVDHPAVAEAAVVGRTHEIKGQAIVAFVTVKASYTVGVAPARPETEAEAAVVDAGRAGATPTVPGTRFTELARRTQGPLTQKIGAIARPRRIIYTADLPQKPAAANHASPAARHCRG